jgi:hypothetical protein
MNQITTLQNEAYPLQLLAAQRQLYASAKSIQAWQLGLLGPAATLAAVLSITVPEVRWLAPVWALSVLLLDLVWLTPRPKRLREAAARVQEKFDCEVLDMKWDQVRAGSPEPDELVFEQAAKYAHWAKRMPGLPDWYPPVVSRIKLPLARLICQRTNCVWDAAQRRHYAVVLASLLVGGLIGVIWCGVVLKLDMAYMLAFGVAPMLPTLKVAFQQWTEHREAADRLDRLRERVERAWKEAITDGEHAGLEELSRAIQGEIFDCRKRNPPVFDFIFKRLRSKREEQMNFSAERFVREAEQQRGESQRGRDRVAGMG